MSEENDFDSFLEEARGAHAASTSTDAEARRVATSLGMQVSWRRRLPAAAAAALATAAPATRELATNKGVATSAKVLAALLPVLGLSIVAYSVATGPSAPATIVETKPVVTTPAARVVEAPAAPPVITLTGPDALPDAKELPEKGERSPKPATSHPRPTDDGTLDAELALLAQVTSALQTGRPARALSLVDEHARRFPNGVLVPEFAAQRVLTLAALGRQVDACAEASSFLSKYPKSPLVPQVRSSCVDPTNSR